MTPDTSEPLATVLVVDDERDLADLYSDWLAPRYDVRTAYGGEEAIELLDEAVDVALVDRLMPDTSGDEVVAQARQAGLDCQISMVTAVEPDFDIIELGFDEYVVKPVRREELIGVVETLQSRSTYDDQLRELYALAAKRAALETEKTADELAHNRSYAELTEEFEALQGELDETTARLSDRDFEFELRKLGKDG